MNRRWDDRMLANEMLIVLTIDLASGYMRIPINANSIRKLIRTEKSEWVITVAKDVINNPKPIVFG